MLLSCTPRIFGFAIISWGKRLKLQKPESAVWCLNANNDEMISHILGKLIMGRDLQCELSFSAAHAMTKYEVWSVFLSSEVFVCLCKASSFPRVCVCVCVFVCGCRREAFSSFICSTRMLWCGFVQKSVCVCVCVAVRLFYLVIFEEDVGLRHCAESSFSFASVCVYVASRWV